MACLVEFNSIEQALSQQDERDKNSMALMGSGKTPKITEYDLGTDLKNLKQPRN